MADEEEVSMKRIAKNTITRTVFGKGSKCIPNGVEEIVLQNNLGIFVFLATKVVTHEHFEISYSILRHESSPIELWLLHTPT